MVSTSEKHQSFVGGKRVAMDREITTVLSTVIESWIKDFKMVQTTDETARPPNSITAGVWRHQGTRWGYWGHQVSPRPHLLSARQARDL